MASALSCGGDESTAPDEHATEASARADVAETPETATEGPNAVPDPTPSDDCDALAAAAEEDDVDAYALALLCPEHPLPPPLQRAALMQADDATTIARVLPRLDPGSEMAGLARLVLREAPATRPDPATDRPEDPARAVVIPVDDAVVAQAALADAVYVSKSVHPDDRTRAQAYLAKTHLYALEGLGLPHGRPLPPFARVLAGRAIHHGRTFCTLYWQRRVQGLAPVFADVEARLFDAILDLELSPHRADSALVATERERGRAYLLLHEERMASARAKRFPSLPPRDAKQLLAFPHRIDRLLDHGFVDLAITLAVARGTDRDGYGLGPAAALVRDAMTVRSLHEYLDKLAARLEHQRARQPPPAETGPTPVEPRPLLTWPRAERTAARAEAWLGAAPDDGFARRHALFRAIHLLREDPTALRRLAARALDEPSLRPYSGLLLALARDLDADTLADARLLERIDETWPEAGRDPKETRARRRLALATREAGNAPR
jgi:hypothetical protein